MNPILPTVGRVLSAHARVRPGAFGARDLVRSVTYGEWNERACRLANALLGLGLTKGQRVAVLAHNRLEWLEIYAATAKAGLVAVPINFRLTPAEVAYIVDDAEAAALIVEDALVGSVDEVRSELAVPADLYVHIGGPDNRESAPPGFQAYEALLAGGAAAEPDVRSGPTTPPACSTPRAPPATRRGRSAATGAWRCWPWSPDWSSGSTRAMSGCW